MTERFLDKVFAKELLTREGRIGVIILYLIMTIGGIYGVQQLEVDFSIEYFVDDGSPLKFYLNNSAKYFNNGKSFTIYTENKDIEYSSVNTQL